MRKELMIPHFMMNLLICYDNETTFSEDLDFFVFVVSFGLPIHYTRQ